MGGKNLQDKETTEKKTKAEKNENRNCFFDGANLANFVVDMTSKVPFEVLNDKYLEYEAFRLNISLDEITQYRSLICTKNWEIHEISEKMSISYHCMLRVIFGDANVGAETSMTEEKLRHLPKIEQEIHWSARNHLGYSFMNLKSEKTEDGKYAIIPLCIESATAFFDMATKAFIDLFDTFKYRKPAGYDYLGKCQKCGKYFAKKRSSQKFCSDRCKNAGCQANYRKAAMTKSV